MRILLLIFCCIIQVPQRIESLSVSNATLLKLHTISQWLDSTNDATVFDYIYRINRGVGLNLYQGDIAGYNPRHGHARTAITNHNQLWNTRIVPYVIDSAFDDAARRDILAAMEEFHSKACLRFVPRTSQTDYVHFKQISGCYSNVGRTGGGQDISLAGPCLQKGTAVHEMMHALGFWHEQSRPDRDSWVRVITGNIQSGKSYNFDKLSVSEADTLGVEYDYGSVMHYSKYAFSRNGNPTILPTRPTLRQLGQRDGLSEHDVQRINILYRCDTQRPSHIQPPITQPPHTQPPITQPPHTQPPITQPPHTQPPHTQPPITQPPHTQPPITQPPHTQPPITQPPITQPPKTQPITQPPQTQPPHTQPPKTQPPQTQPPKTQPITQPPQTQPPHTKQPKTQPPQTQPPVTQPPQTQQPQTQSPQTHTTHKPATTQQTQPTHHPVTMAPVGWTTWSGWTPCDLECRHSRYRFCLNYDPAYCPGESSEVRNCSFPCRPAVSLGCWKSGASGQLVPSVENMADFLNDPYRTRTEAVRKCSEYAAQHGYTAFALFDGGMCLTGPNAHKDFSKAGASGECGYKGIGGPGACNVFSFSSDIDGQWGLWTPWGRCDRTCGFGRRYRYRRCDNPPAVGNGAQCPGDAQQVAICDVRACFVQSKCGMRYHAGGPGTSGLIRVKDYDNFMECEYLIATGDPRASISVYIHEIDVEYSRGCIYDAVMLHDGSGSWAPLVGAYCGQTPPGTFESTANRLYLRFEADETNTGRGFTVFYNINSISRKACVQPPPAPHMYVTIEGNMVGDRASYRCHPGYKMIGHGTLTCRDQPGFALWDESFPKCVSAQKRSVSQRFTRPCDFEASLCGFTNDVNNDFNWTVHRPDNATSAVVIGPRGNYLQTTSTRLQAPGDLARASLSLGQAPYPQCLKFQYIIDGEDLAMFNVYTTVIEANVTSDGVAGADVDKCEMLVWSRRGETGQHSNWQTASVKLAITGDVQLMFEAVLGDEIGSSVAIDDIVLTHDCGTM